MTPPVAIDRVRELPLSAAELRDAWAVLSPEERLEGLRLLTYHEAEDVVRSMQPREVADVLVDTGATERRSWMRLLPPDDAADVIQAAPEELRGELLELLDAPTRKEVSALLAYAEDDAGGLMSPRYARLRPDMRADEAIAYLRHQTRDHIETIYYVYVLDAEQHLLGVISFRDLFSAAADRRVREIMRTEVLTVHEEMDQEAVSRLFKEHDFLAIPVVDDENRVKGIVTVDDIVDVVEEEATEDIQKYGGMAALEAPYLETSFWSMVRKRGGWLSVLFLGEMLTATAMGWFEKEIARAVVLTTFIPLIISSGGNSGSQASTLVIRAMALSELGLRDWWRVVRREVAAGLALGTLLGSIGLVRILAWDAMFHVYDVNALGIGLTIAVSLLGVVLFGTIAGSMLPLVFHSFGFDPASASAPFVATLVDVSGLVIYFSVASALLRGTLL